jgi:O-antigen/teichoic acid export membrane protein
MLTPPENSTPSPDRTKPPRRVVRNLVFSVFTKAQGGVFSYLTTLLLLRAFKVEEYGLYSVLFLGLIPNLALAARFGVPNLLMRFIPEYFYQNNFRMISRLLRAANIFHVASAGLLLAVTLLFAETLSGWFHFPQSSDVLRVFAVGAFVFLLGENYRILFGSVFLHSTIFWRNLIYNILRLAGIYIATRTDNPLQAVVIVEAVLYVVSLILFVVAYQRNFAPRAAEDHGPHEPAPRSRFVNYAILGYANELGVMLLNWAVDLFIVSAYLGGETAAMYGLAMRAFAIVHGLLPSNFLSVVITPLFFSEYGASKEQARFGFTLLVKTSLLSTIPIAVWLTIMSRAVIVDFFDPRYAVAGRLLGVMAAFIFMEQLRYPLGLVLQNAERNDLLLYSKVFGVLKIAAGLCLVPLYGAMSMVWITCLAISGQNLLSYYWIVRILKSPTDHKGVGRLLLNGLISAAIFYPLHFLFRGPVGVLGSGLVYLLIFLAINILHKGFTPEERDFINQKIPWRIWLF